MHIKIDATDKELSSNAGLIIFKELLSKQHFDTSFQEIVPKQKSGSSKNIKKIEQLMLAFHAGAEWLDDIDRLRFYGAFRAVCGGKPYSSKSCADLLRNFSSYQCKQVNHKLVTNGYSLRGKLFPKEKSMTIDIDSTKIEQFGKKMEGVVRHYSGSSP